MKRRLTMILMAAALSLTALTGCGGNKETKTVEKTATTKQEAGNEEAVEKEKDTETPDAEEEATEWHLDKETIESAPEGSVFLAPALDADGNYPEDFDMESYDGIVGNLYGTEEERAEAEKTGKESKNKKEDSKEKKESGSEKKEDSKKKK